jgi:hypothetical protein
MSTQIKQFDELVSQVTQFVAPTKDIKVTDNSSADKAIETGKAVKDFLKKVETKRKELVGPLNDQVKLINDYAKDITAPLLKAESHIKKELSDFAIEQELIRRKEREKLEAERREAQAKIDAEIALASAKCETEVEKLAAAVAIKNEVRTVTSDFKAREKAIEATAMKGVRQTWKAEVVNEMLLPREYLIPDTVKINKVVSAGIRDIPGIRIYQETSISLGKTTAVPVAALVDDFFGGKQ